MSDATMTELEIVPGPHEADCPYVNLPPADGTMKVCAACSCTPRRQLVEV